MTNQATLRDLVLATLLAVTGTGSPDLAELVATDLKVRLKSHGYAIHDIARCVRPAPVEGRPMTDEEARAVVAAGNSLDPLPHPRRRR